MKSKRMSGWTRKFKAEGKKKYGHMTMETGPKSKYVHKPPKQIDSDSPYVLPTDMPVQFSFSGGRSSAFMLYQTIQANNGIPDHCEVIFNNTGKEMPQTLDFVHECGKRWGVKIVWLEYRCPDPLGRPGFEIVNHNSASRNGEPFEMVIYNRAFLPNPVTRYCTTELKIRTAKRYLRWKGWDHWYSVVGFRADESHRLANAKKNESRDRWIYLCPMVADNVNKFKVQEFWKDQDFDLQLPNIKGKCWLGNCDGCFLKSMPSKRDLLREYPENFEWWEEWERKILSNVPHPKTGDEFVSWRKDYRLEDIRKDSANQGQFKFQNLAHGCGAEDGECTGF